MLKLHKLFDTTVSQRTFHKAILPMEYQREELVQAKNDIRDHLRTDIETASVTVLGMTRKVTPRFRTQGSWAYRTCIQWAQQPPQEMDWDFGVYLPVNVWQESGPPAEMAKKYFDLVEKSLKRLCESKGWKLISGKYAKNTCIRVQVTSWGHIDIPLYAAPALEFERIVEAAALKSERVEERAKYLGESSDFGELIEQDWDDLLDDIYMAQRDGEWKKSDPAQVSRWFLDQVAEHGEQLRRTCCYMKAWRDFTWSEGGPTSICLMIAVAQNFKPIYGRDDLVLEAAAKRVAAALLGEIREPGIDEGAEDFNCRLSDAQKRIASTAAAKLAQQIELARSQSDIQKFEAIRILQGVLGSRIPSDTSLIDVETRVEVITSEPARVVPAPVVRRTSAG